MYNIYVCLFFKWSHYLFNVDSVTSMVGIKPLYITRFFSFSPPKRVRNFIRLLTTGENSNLFFFSSVVVQGFVFCVVFLRKKARLLRIRNMEVVVSVCDENKELMHVLFSFDSPTPKFWKRDNVTTVVHGQWGLAKLVFCIQDIEAKQSWALSVTSWEVTWEPLVLYPEFHDRKMES